MEPFLVQLSGVPQEDLVASLRVLSVLGTEVALVSPVFGCLGGGFTP